MTTITVEHVTKTFHESTLPGSSRHPIPALDDVSLKIDVGQVLAVLGPSGCGKSTLLRIIAGLIDTDSGQVLYDRVPVQNIDPRERGIGMVFQDGALIPHWEARKSVGFFLRLRKREEEVPERVQQIANITGFGLDVLLGRRPSQLSGGEKQRISIARALTRDLSVLLMDEPFANIDAKLRAQARVELKRLLQRFPVTAVYVTHDQIEAVALAQRVAVMNKGRIEQVGTYQQLYHQPMNLFVATFIGTQAINLFHGFAISGTWRGDSFSGLPLRPDLEEGTRVIMGIRPEHITLATPDQPFTAEGQVRAITPYFAERHQLVEVRGNGETWQMHIAPDEVLHVGDTIRCALMPNEYIFFDPVTERRIG